MWFRRGRRFLGPTAPGGQAEGQEQGGQGRAAAHCRSSWLSSRRIRAGTPPTTVKGGTSRCTTAPAVLWDALYQMVTTLFQLYEDEEEVMVDRAFNSCSNLRLARGEGTMTRKNAGLMRNYSDTYEGRVIDIQAHIKTAEVRPGSPKFLRIYFCYDPALHKIIVGSCG